MAKKYQGKVVAPEFPGGLPWLNATGPLTLSAFSGKLLLLNFWTSSRVDCIQLVPVLRKLEQDYPEEFAVVGVHTPKFDEERATENVRQALMRYGVSHPVVNDAERAVWQAYEVESWPTLVFVDPLGKVVGRLEGPITYEQGVTLIDEMLTEFRANGTLRPSPSAITLEQPPAGILSYPAKVLADPDNERLFIADSGHHRVLLTDMDGEVQTVIGSGVEGLADGLLEGAKFRHPQGLLAVGDLLYVADTGNHAIRIVDLEVGIVETIAGTGEQGIGRVEGGAALEVALRSPSDLALVGRNLHIAMAGSHQIWALNLDTYVVQAIVGTGAESIIDGPPEEAELAQPSGITTDEDDVLYFVDSETSSIRSADIRSAHEVTTLTGTGLFDFGDVGGEGASAKLQHPQGIDCQDQFLYVADTYNHKIKVIESETRVVATLAGSGEAGSHDGALGEASFYEPGGLSAAGDLVYVADTNNHAIRVVDLEAREVRTLNVDF